MGNFFCDLTVQQKAYIMLRRTFVQLTNVPCHRRYTALYVTSEKAVTTTPTNKESAREQNTAADVLLKQIDSAIRWQIDLDVLEYSPDTRHKDKLERTKEKLFWRFSAAQIARFLG